MRTQRKALRLEVAEPSVCTLSDIGWHVRTDSRARASTRQLSRSPSLNTKQPHLFSSAAGEVPTRLGNIQFAGAFGLEHQLELKHE